MGLTRSLSSKSTVYCELCHGQGRACIECGEADCGSATVCLDCDGTGIAPYLVDAEAEHCTGYEPGSAF